MNITSDSCSISIRTAWIALRIFSSELFTLLQSDYLDNLSCSPFLSNEVKVEVVSLAAALNLYNTVLPLPQERSIWSLSDMEAVISMGKVAFDTTSSKTHAFHKANSLLKVAQCDFFKRVYAAWTVFQSKIADARLIAGGQSSNYIPKMADLIHARLGVDRSVMMRLEASALEAYSSRFSVMTFPCPSTNPSTDIDGTYSSREGNLTNIESATPETDTWGEERVPSDFDAQYFPGFETGMEHFGAELQNSPFDVPAEECHLWEGYRDMN